MIHILLSLTILATPAAPLAIEISEPITLTTGETLEARYLEPSDEFCLKLEDFAQLQGDQLHAKVYWEGRIDRLKADFVVKLGDVQRAHREVHKAFLKEQELLKTELAESIKQRDLARADMWWWRGATLALALSTGVTAVYLISR
jgi:hypothetical protein